MSTFTKVVLATDLSEQADKLTGCLFSICPDTETEVVLAHVFDSDDDADPHGSNYKKVYSRLEGYKNELLQAGYEEVKIVTPSGDTCDALNKLAEEENAELLMTASHKKGFLQRAFLGSTTLELAKHSVVPLFVDKSDKEDENEDLLQTVLIPTDFSRESLAGLNTVRSLREYVGKVIFVHIIEHTRDKHDYKEKYGNATMFLKELVEEMKIFGIEAEYHVGHGSMASKKIAGICEREKVTLILMGKVGAEMAPGVQLGSTTENLMASADCALLLMPAQDSDE